MDATGGESEKDKIALFMEISASSSVDVARQFLTATDWRVEEAIQLFYMGNEENGAVPPGVGAVNPVENPNLPLEPLEPLESSNDEVRAPLPVKREALYADSFIAQLPRNGPHQPNPVVAFRNFAEEARRSDVWESDQAAASSTGPRDNLAALYRPPYAIMYQGTFEQAKLEAARLCKWLIINIQSTKEFSSHLLNSDTWSNEAVTQTITGSFIFWQVYDDTTEGRKVCTYYNLVKIPAVLVIDPITGQKMRSWNGMVEPERLLEDLLPYLDKDPKDHRMKHPSKRPRENGQTDTFRTVDAQPISSKPEEDEELLKALAASLEENVKQAQLTNDTDTREAESQQHTEIQDSARPTYPPLPDEPQCDKSLQCQVGVRLPDGRRLRRNFLRTDTIQLLWSFCCSVLKEAESRPFHLTEAIPGATKQLDFDSNLSFEEAGICNSMVSLTWK